jgi:hypothetical protein
LTTNKQFDYKKSPIPKHSRQQKVLCNWGKTLKQSSAVHIQALVSADVILPGSSSILRLLVINLASVPGRQLVNSPTAQSPGRCAQQPKMKRLLTLWWIFIISCSNEQKPTPAEVRNPGIPKDAFFVKGINTGYWCKADIHNHRNNVTMSIYNSADGRLVMVKRFFVICKLEGSYIWIEDLEEQIEYFDGEIFHLKRPEGKDSCWMQGI